MPAMEVEGQGGLQIAQFKAPDGHVIGIMQSPAMAWRNVGRWCRCRWAATSGRRAVFPRRNVMQVSGIEVVVQFCVDPEKAKAWYADFLGVETTPYPSPLFVLEGATLLLAPGAPGTGRGGTGVYFHVESVDAAYQELTARGYRFNEAPYDVPVGRLVTLNDPDGNIVGLEDRSKGGLAGVGL
jgi:predicted enzyme related to lactoylglutathione lyase